MSISIDSHNLGFLILCYLIEQAESGDVDQLVQTGFSADILTALRRMPVSELSRVAGTLRVFEVLVDVNRIEEAMRSRLGLRSTAEDLAYLARAGATAVILAEVFRITVDEAEIHLSTLSTSKRRGRPSMPDDHLRETIQHWWADANKNGESTLRHRLINLHKQWPMYSVASLYAVINEFN
jgi:hypothetical protein